LNELEKKSFYSFVALYLGSSLLFILLSGYWYYSAQKNALENETYYKLEHIADKLSGSIINAQMRGTTLELPNKKGFEYHLVQNGEEAKKYASGYFEKNGYKVLVSAGPQEHLNIKYVVIKTKSYFSQLHKLQKEVLFVMFLSFIAIVFISFLLSKLFMKPVHERMTQIENFIRDVSHELNTPITALKMSASRAIKKEVYDKKILTNISISTKQLESIYKSLTFLNFKEATQKEEPINLKETIEQVVEYYAELTDAKHIKVVLNLEDKSYLMLRSKAELLISNLLSNAVKYSMPETTIRLTLNNNSFIIEDEGMGIAKEKLDKIFNLYQRNSNLAGGFGVGLSIVKQICKEYDINVDVSSELEKGTKFSLKF
jgi:two-component system OmpR family sensor kinase